ncbi:hypothetical protein [Streptomyces sp. B27]|uniref:hypothetical protein n=1 Tax=Streptomyces TaxID=1883 RepID=UPI0013E3A505|nr:hypothetical protein [Streptomyces sp. B27]
MQQLRAVVFTMDAVELAASGKPGHQPTAVVHLTMDLRATVPPWLMTEPGRILDGRAQSPQ